ncbi:MAG TPA: hypothetical protein DCM67_13695 [Propionibacteriaceae bacterium]|nr:hypothetical protein [Propionibacteriaceae bacterium]
MAHGETGYLVESRDPLEWTAVLQTLLADPVTLSRLGTVARVYARHFDWAWTARRLAACYADLTEPRP